MNKIILAALALAAADPIAAAVPAAATHVNASNPAAVRALFERWGYRPTPIVVNEGLPVFNVTVDDIATGVGLGGCTDNRDCTYLILVAVYGDIANPPLEWLNARNREYDLATLTRLDTGELRVHTAIMLGTHGITEELLRTHLAEWVTTNQHLSRLAIDAHLVAPE